MSYLLWSSPTADDVLRHTNTQTHTCLGSNTAAAAQLYLLTKQFHRVCFLLQSKNEGVCFGCLNVVLSSVSRAPQGLLCTPFTDRDNKELKVGMQQQELHSIVLGADCSNYKQAQVCACSPLLVLFKPSWNLKQDFYFLHLLFTWSPPPPPPCLSCHEPSGNKQAHTHMVINQSNTPPCREITFTQTSWSTLIPAWWFLHTLTHTFEPCDSGPTSHLQIGRN